MPTPSPKPASQVPGGLAVARYWTWPFALLAFSAGWFSTFAPQGLAAVMVGITLMILTAYAIQERNWALFDRRHLTVWAIVSALVCLRGLLSPDPLYSVAFPLRASLTALQGLILYSAFRLMTPAECRLATKVLLVGLGLGIALLALQVANETWLSPGYSDFAIPFIGTIKKQIVIVACLLPAGLYALFTLKDRRVAALSAAIGLALFTYVLIAWDTETGGFAAAAALGAALGAFLFGRWFVKGVGLLQGLLILAAPFIVLAIYDLPVVQNIHWRSANADMRIEIWAAVSDYALKSPIFGNGIETAKFVRDWSVEFVDYPKLKVWHPHNATLQVWFEFGLVGALSLAAAWIATCFATARLDRPTMISVYAGLMAIFFAVHAEFSIWSSWRLSLIVLIVLLPLCVAKGRQAAVSSET